MSTGNIPLKLCAKCGNEYPTTTDFFRKIGKWFLNICRECEREARRQYYAKNPDRAREYAHRYRESNPERVREATHEWRESNREYIREYSCQYYAANTERAREASRRWKQMNPERKREGSRRWQRANPEKGRLVSQRRKSRKRSMPNDFTQDQWGTCLDYFHHTCAYCGAQQDFWHVLEMEHFIPLSSPNCTGTTAKNIVPACKSCNSSKHDKPADVWLTEVYGKRKAKQIVKRIQDYFNSITEPAANTPSQPLLLGGGS